MSEKRLAWALGLLGVLIFCLGMTISASAAVQEAQQPATVRSEEATAEEIGARVERSLAKIDVDRIVADALEAARRALDEVDVAAEVQKALQEIDVDKVVSEAMEKSKHALQEANVELEVRKAMEEIDVEKIVSDAMKAVEKAREQVRRDLEKVEQP